MKIKNQNLSNFLEKNALSISEFVFVNCYQINQSPKTFAIDALDKEDCVLDSFLYDSEYEYLSDLSIIKNLLQTNQ